MDVDRGTTLWRRTRQRMGAIRVRTTAAAILAVGVSLILASVAMLTLLQRSLRTDVRTTAEIRAETIAGDLAVGPDSPLIAAASQDEEFVQVLDGAGNVVLASPNLAGVGPIAVVEPGGERTIPEVPFEDSEFLAVGMSTTGERGDLLVVVGRSLEPVTEARRVAAGLLAIGAPLLLVIVGGVTWRVVGRALAPVDSIRAEVEAISSRELHRRVPDPPGDDEIARLATTMNRMLSRLEDAQKRERRFLSDASHELRSPIATIRQHAEVALSHPDRTSIGELAETVLDEDIRLQAIVEDLLLLSRIDEGTLQLRTEAVDLDDLVFEEAARLRGSTDLKIDSTDVSAARVSGDRRKLERLLRNLTDNAARHASARIRLAVRAVDLHVVLHVDDDGSGVPEESRRLVFERFTRLDEARDREVGGTGLGLAIVAEVAAAHGGTVSVGDAPLGGARFELVLPRLVSEEPPARFRESSGRAP